MISNCSVIGLECLPYGLKDLYMYEVYSDTEYFEIPPLIRDCIIICNSRNSEAKGLINEGYYKGEIINFKEYKIKDNKILKH